MKINLISIRSNCFLNVAIQALWHLGPFRYELQNFIKNPPTESKAKIMPALCKLFYDYENAVDSVLPPTELRNALSSISDRFQIGSIADSNEALDVILDQLHEEHEYGCVAAPGIDKQKSSCCISHKVFGAMMMEQTICSSCRTIAEPAPDYRFIHNFYATELIELGKEHFLKKLGLPYNFGKLLNKCVQVPPRECPSIDDKQRLNKNPNAPAYVYCTGKAKVRTFCLEQPMGLALSVSWSQEYESSETIRDFLSLVSYTLKLSDVYDATIGKTTTLEGDNYLFRGLICYYGRHYVSIFQEYSFGEPKFLLFDDQNIRSIGSWSAVKKECIRGRYQPVLLLYERENFESLSVASSAESSSSSSSATGKKGLFSFMSGRKNASTDSSPKDSDSTNSPRKEGTLMKLTRTVTNAFLKKLSDEDDDLRKTFAQTILEVEPTPPAETTIDVMVFSEIFDGRKLIGISFEQIGSHIIALDFNKHPITHGSLPAEKTGQILLFDELIGVNDVLFVEGDANLNWSVLDKFNPNKTGETFIKFKMRRHANVEHLKQQAALKPSSTLSNVSTLKANLPVNEAPVNIIPNLKADSSKPITLNKSEVSSRSLVYTVLIVPESVDGKCQVGLFMEKVNEKLIVADFPRNAVTGEPLPAERCGKIQIMDHLVRVDDIVLPKDNAKEAWNIMTGRFGLPSASENGLKLSFKSRYLKEAFFTCPNTTCNFEITVQKEEREV